MALSLIAALLAASLWHAPAAAQAEPAPCVGTLLQLSVAEQGTTSTVRFRFTLALSGEGDRAQAALNQLQERLRRLRVTLQPLILGTLTVTAPSTYRQSSHAGGVRQHIASTVVSGEVNRRTYKALIEAVGGLSGVRLQGMTSQADSKAAELVQQQLTVAALRRGTTEAEAMAAAIGASRVRLLRINRIDALARPRAMALETTRSGFKPGEAPKPIQTLRLQLEYCLS